MAWFWMCGRCVALSHFGQVRPWSGQVRPAPTSPILTHRPQPDLLCGAERLACSGKFSGDGRLLGHFFLSLFYVVLVGFGTGTWLFLIVAGLAGPDRDLHER